MIRTFLPRKWFAFWLFAVVLVLNGAAIFSSHVALQEVKERDIRRTEMKSQDLALAVAQSTDNLLDKIDICLRLISHDMERRLRRGESYHYATRRVLSHQFKPVAETEELSVTDSNGSNIIHDSLEKHDPFDISDREYFIALKNGHPGLSVSRPLVSRISGKPVLTLARGIRNPDGSFGGAVVMAVPLEHLEKIVAGFALGDHSILNLRSDDSSLIAYHRHPGRTVDLKPGSHVSPSKEVRQALAQNPQGATYSAVTPADGVKRLFSYKRLSLAPIYAICGIAEDEFLGEWYRLRYISRICLGAFFILSLFAAWILHRFWRRQQQYAAGLQESNEQLQAALKEVRALDQALLAAREVGGLGTYSLDIANDIWTRSAHQETIFGISPDYPRNGAGWRALVHADDLPIVLEYIEELTREGLEIFDSEYRIIRPNDGAERWLHAIGKLEFDGRGALIRVTGAVKDITDQKASQERMAYLAYHDILTDLPNRALLTDRLHQAQVQARRRQEILAVCYLDLDGFKPVNDAWGHDIGDLLLIEVAHRLQECTRGETPWPAWAATNSSSCCAASKTKPSWRTSRTACWRKSAAPMPSGTRPRS